MSQSEILFDRVASGYDDPALRFFPFCADHMIARLRPRPGSKLLDVATGTGAVAVSAAQVIGPSGRVMGIDLAENMLDQAQRKAEKMAVDNIDFHVMDAAQLEFRAGYFDNVVCAFGVFFLPDMEAAVRDWLRVTRPGGTVMFSTFRSGAFAPIIDLYRQRLERLGVQVSEPAWSRLSRPEHSEALLSAAGATDIEVEERQFGYHLQSTEDWWAVLWNSSFRGYLEQLTDVQLAEFKREHLEEVSALTGENGIWMDVPVLIARGRRPLG